MDHSRSGPLLPQRLHQLAAAHIAGGQIFQNALFCTVAESQDQCEG